MSKLKNVLSIAACTVLSASVAIGSVACGGEKLLDSENRSLVISTSAPDDVFNPFFSTSAVDANMIGMTQIGLMSADKNGNVVCGQNEPSVALDHSIRTVTENGQQYTYYQFIIKKGIQFSDGEPLTIADVLFNLYVYLDPVYTGSATIYSTDIVGLSEYRYQEEEISDTLAAQKEEAYLSKADERREDVIKYVYNQDSQTPAADKTGSGKYSIDSWDEAMIEQAKGDFETTAKAFKEELLSDWNGVTSSLDSYKETYGFTDAWQIFLVNDGGFNLYKYNSNGTIYKDETGNFRYDPASSDAVDAQQALTAYLNEHKSDAGYTEETATRDWAIQYVYDLYFGETIQSTRGDNFEMVARYWGTASTIISKFAAEAKEADLKPADGTLKIASISGIQALKGSEFVASSDSSSSNAKYSADYDMLQIKIKGVDPKAIYNFCFQVAPLHYYSKDGYQDKNKRTYNLISDFSVENNNFGVSYSDSKFMTEVVNDPAKIGVPVGAGPYKATDINSSDTPSASGFESNNIIYFKRNDYFTTVGTGLENAKIRLVRYQVVNSDQIVNALNTGAIDYGDPSATQFNITNLNDNITRERVTTNGYGYVGINARFIPNITVRRAIMKSMNLSIITDDYYKGGLAELIYRSMSTTSWAYPDGATTYTSKGGGNYNNGKVKYDYNASVKYEIEAMLKSLEKEGYELNAQGVYTNGRDTLSYTFTIAGGSTDHPAYAMFLESAKLLNSIEGINVKVVTSQTALSDLTTGKLQVWAAAWTSAIDPDMYQVYHKDSTASSVKNWGYDYIIAGKNDTYSYEWGVLQQLSEIIDEARSTNDQDERAALYSEALDLVMELAVELPTYQRNDLFAYNNNVLDGSTLQHGDQLTAYNSPLGRMWEVDYV